MKGYQIQKFAGFIVSFVAIEYLRQKYNIPIISLDWLALLAIGAGAIIYGDADE